MLRNMYYMYCLYIGRRLLLLILEIFSQTRMQFFLPKQGISCICYFWTIVRFYTVDFRSLFTERLQSLLSILLITLPKFEYCVENCKGNHTSCFLKYRSTELEYQSTEYRFLICSVLKR